MCFLEKDGSNHFSFLYKGLGFLEGLVAYGYHPSQGYRGVPGEGLIFEWQRLEASLVSNRGAARSLHPNGLDQEL